MKKLIIAASALLLGIFTAKADYERPIRLEELPAPAQEFLRTHFSDLTVAYVSEESETFYLDYEVLYTDRTEVNFNQSGEWTSVERKYSAVPDALIPNEIKDNIGTLSFGQGQFVRKIERKGYMWEVELSNGIELTYDNQFKLMDIDD